MRRGRRVAGQRGETLLELLVAITIMGIAVPAIASGMALSITVSDIHRKQATASAYVRSYAESIENTVATSSWPGCSASAATYQSPAGFSLPSNGDYTASVSNVEFWDVSSFVGTCATDTGLQRLTLTVASTDQRATENLMLVVREPCVTSCG